MLVGTGTTVRVTGPPATFTDQLAVGESGDRSRSLHGAVGGGILLIVYRSVFTALMPLLVVGMAAWPVGRGVLSGSG